ncbi:MAG: O-antigen ligase family protein, partial [Planctomycetota bacterium]
SLTTNNQTMLKNSTPQSSSNTLARAWRTSGWTASALLWALLVAYLIVNKPVALLGIPPIYIGELVLACVLFAAVGRYREFVIEPVRRAWTFRLIAIFFLYGVARVALDVPDFGLLALRDGVIVFYALLVFLAPAVWSRHSAFSQSERETTLPTQVARVLLPASLLAAGWAAAIAYGYIDIWQLGGGFFAETKPDFLTLAAAIAFWVFTISAMKHQPFFPSIHNQKSKIKNSLMFLVAIVISLNCLWLMLHLPTRAVHLSLGPLLLISVIVWAFTRRRRMLVWIVGGLVLLAGVVVITPRIKQNVTAVCRKYAPNENLNFSIRQVELNLLKNPEVYPQFNVNLDLMNLTEKARRERWQSIFSIDQKEFETLAGQRAADATEWRLTFWLRSFYYTLHHAPIFGIGFGKNITNVNRRAPDLRSRESLAWRMFIPAMSVQNRNPHSAHLTIFTRMGLIGLSLWLAILGLIFVSALRSCWFYRRMAASGNQLNATEHYRCAFWDTLTVLGVWVIYLTTMSFSVVLENPFGGMWFWALTGVLVFSRTAKE